MQEQDYINKNKETWNIKTDIHIASAFYDMDSFLKGKNTLNDIELDLLGDVSGKSILHLQCHFGQDSISLARLGAMVTGVDFSENAVRKANELAAQLNVNASFICCDVYSLPQFLDGSFDMVFTSYGTIGWLPDMDRWASVVSRYLKPGGKFLMAEFHPVVWMYDNDFERVIYKYAVSSPIVETETGTYADKSAPVTTETITWNHGIGEVLNSLIYHGLEINQLQEYDYSPYNCFNKVEEFAPGKFRISVFGNNIPMVYSILATKK